MKRLLLTNAQKDTVNRLKRQGWRVDHQEYEGIIWMSKHGSTCDVRPDGSIDGDA
jgi:hypothetical protein